MKISYTDDEVKAIIEKERLYSRIDTETKIMMLIEQLDKDDRVKNCETLVKVVYNVLKKSINKLEGDLQLKQNAQSIH